jgi:double-stranded uracil-DNA glycosylase
VAAGRTVPEVAAADLDVLFCGINPGRWSAAVGNHFAHPGNRFWKLLRAAELTPELLEPSEEQRLLGCGLGVTNLVARSTATAAELSGDELREGANRLEATARRWRPVVVAVLGLGAYRTAFSRPRATIGEQPERLGPSVLWVLANPSGLQGHYRFEDQVAELGRLRAAVARLRAVPADA